MHAQRLGDGFQKRTIGKGRLQARQKRPRGNPGLVVGTRKCDHGRAGHLARKETADPIEEWVPRLPDFHLKPGTQLVAPPGVAGLMQLPLEWNPA